MISKKSLLILIVLIFISTGCTLLSNLPEPADTGGGDQVGEVDLTATGGSGCPTASGNA